MPRILSESAIQRVGRVVRKVESQPPGGAGGPSPGLSAALTIYIAKTPAGGIAAMSGSTPGSASCTLYYINAGGTLTQYQDAGGAAVTKTVLNLSSEAVAGSAYIMAIQELLSGKLLAVWEDCA